MDVVDILTNYFYSVKAFGVEIIIFAVVDSAVKWLQTARLPFLFVAEKLAYNSLPRLSILTFRIGFTLFELGHDTCRCYSNAEA